MPVNAGKVNLFAAFLSGAFSTAAAVMTYKNIQRHKIEGWGYEKAYSDWGNKMLSAQVSTDPVLKGWHAEQAKETDAKIHACITSAAPMKDCKTIVQRALSSYPKSPGH